MLSIALLILGVAGVAGNLVVTRAARHFTSEKMLVCAIALLAADLVFMQIMPLQIGWLFAALVIWALATDITWPSQQRRMVELAPKTRGVALALTSSSVYLGIGAGSAVAGEVYPLFGFTGLLWSSLTLLTLAATSLLLSVRFRA